MNKEYANYDYQTVTVPLKTEYGVTVGAETKSTYKLCTKDCKYQHNWNELKNWLEDENNQKYSQYIYNYSINDWVLNKMQELEEGGNNE